LLFKQNPLLEIHRSKICFFVNKLPEYTDLFQNHNIEIRQCYNFKFFLYWKEIFSEPLISLQQLQFIEQSFDPSQVKQYCEFYSLQFLEPFWHTVLFS